MKIIVCSLYINPWYREIVKYGKLSIERYCRKNKYTFMYETESTPGGVYDAKRDIPWYKVLLLLKIMNTVECDFVVWNDADSMIINYDKKLEHIIENDLGKKDILVARDCHSILNTGTMFLRNCEYTKQVLQAIWDNEMDFDKNLHEQSSLTSLYNKNLLNLHNNMEILPLYRQNDFLTYWYTYLPDKCFIVHATRCSHDKIGFIFTMDMFCTIQMDEETVVQYLDRVDWLMTNRCLEDIQTYRNGGNRRNLTARYIKMLSGVYRVE